MQRFFDVFFSLISICVLAPFLVPIAIALRLTGEGEVFYKQARVGRYGREFALLKFATMLKDSPNLGAGEITLKNDSRILPFGSFLRKTKINELPQLLNILKGDISVVGPRPMVPRTFALYERTAKQKLSEIRPGLTGVGSIFFRDEERFLDGMDDPMQFYREVIIPFKTSLELWYVENRSILLYFTLFFITAWVVVFPKSQIIWWVFPELPKPPEALAAFI